MVSAVRLELERVRGGGEQNKIARLAPNDSAFELGFPVATRTGYSYFAEIRHERGGAVVARVQLPSSRAGYFNLVFNRRPFDPGAYTLSVFETGSYAPGPERPESEKLVVQYDFSVEAEPVPPH
jgi:hypothetical protein